MTSQGKMLVTAAGAGLGRSIAVMSSKYGYRVLAADNNKEALDALACEHDKITCQPCDVRSTIEIEQLCEVFSAWPESHITLVNCVGVPGPIAPVDDISDDDWDETIATNLSSIFKLTKRLVPAMKKAGTGSIINISTLSVRLAPKNRAPYNASKAGLLGFSRSLAKELGPFGIRCNAILPGPINGPRMDRLMQILADEHGQTKEEAVANTCNYIALRSFVEPEEVAEVVLFLASRAAAKVTAQEIDVSGFAQWEE